MIMWSDPFRSFFQIFMIKMMIILWFSFLIYFLFFIVI